MSSIINFERNRYIIFLALLAFSFTTNTYSQRNYFTNTGKRVSKNTYQMEKDVFRLVNKERKKRGLRELTWNSRLSSVARNHSSDMAKNNYFSHRSRNGKTLVYRAKKLGIRGMRGIGENLAYNKNHSKPAKFALQTWMKSSGHRKNLLNSIWKETGIGIAVSRNGTYYFTEVFLVR